MTDIKPKNLHQRINEVMATVDSVRKDRVNTHHGYNYTGHEDVTAALRAAMVSAGIVQTVNLLEHGRLESGAMFAMVEVRWVNVDFPQDYVPAVSYGESGPSGRGGPTPQQIGVAVSYAVKWAQLKNFMLLGDETPDAERYHDAPPPVPERPDVQVDPGEVQMWISQIENAGSRGEVKQALRKLGEFKQQLDKETAKRIGRLATQKLEQLG